MKTKDTKTKIEEALNYIQNDTEIAIEIFDNILEFEPENIDALNGKGSALMKLNRMDEAEIYFNHSLSIEKTSSALISKGIICKNKMDFENALNFYDEAIKLNPNLNNIINLLKNEILELIDNKININSIDQDANELIDKGLKYKKSNKLWDALDCYMKAIEIDNKCQDSVEALINEIIAVLQNELMIKTPEFTNTRTNQLKIKSLRLFLIEENPKEALSAMNFILKNDENEIDTLNQKGCILFSCGEYQKSLECFDKCLNIDENYYYARFNKAIVLRITNRLEESLDCFDELLKIPEIYEKAKPYQLEILDNLHEKSKS